MKKEREIVAYKRYFLDFYKNQNSDVQSKIEWVLKFIKVTPIIPEKFFKHVEGT